MRKKTTLGKKVNCHRNTRDYGHEAFYSFERSALAFPILILNLTNLLDKQGGLNKFLYRTSLG